MDRLRPAFGTAALLTKRSVARIVLTAAVIVLALYLLYEVRNVLGQVLIAVFLAVALGPAVDLVQRRGVPRGLSILLVYLTILLALFGIGLVMVPPIVEGIDEFTQDAPTYIEELRDNDTLRQYDDQYQITERLQEQAAQLPARLGDAAGALQSVTVGVFSTLFQLLTILVMAFFILLDGRKIIRFATAQLEPDVANRAATVATRVYRAVGGYVAGAFSIAVLAGVSAYIALTLIGVPFVIPLAVLAAFFSLIPLVGATIAGVIIGLVAAVDNFPTSVIIWTIYFLVYQQVENNVLQPSIYRRTVKLHPLLVIVAVLIGASLLGILGALLAIPAAATVQILVKDWWHYRREAGAPAPSAEEAPVPDVADAPPPVEPDGDGGQPARAELAGAAATEHPPAGSSDPDRA